MTRAFTMRQVRTLEPAVCADAEALAAELFVGGPEVDLFSRFVRPLPSRTIARFFGLPVEEAPRFSGWSDAFLVPQMPGLPEGAYVAAARQYAQFDDYVRSLVTRALSDVGPGIVHDVVTGHRNGTHDLTQDELVGDIANVLFAGHETTVSTLSNLPVRNLRDRPLWTALAAGEVDLPPLVDELLRLDTSGGLFRTCPESTTLAGVHLPAGARTLCLPRRHRPRPRSLRRPRRASGAAPTRRRGDDVRARRPPVHRHRPGQDAGRDSAVGPPAACTQPPSHRPGAGGAQLHHPHDTTVAGGPVNPRRPRSQAPRRPAG